MPVKPTSMVWMDGQMVHWEKATVHVLTHSLHYGTGAFEGIRCYPTADGPAVFRLREHMQRLVNSCKVLLIPLPYDLEELIEASLEVVRVNDASEGVYLRPLVYLGYGEMGVNPAPAPVNVAIAAWPWGAYLGDEGLSRGVALVTSTWRRHDPNSVPSVAKSTGGYVNGALAKLEAVNAGYDEAIMLGTDGMVSEATGRQRLHRQRRRDRHPEPVGRRRPPGDHAGLRHRHREAPRPRGALARPCCARTCTSRTRCSSRAPPPR